MDNQWNLLSWWSKCNNLLILKNRTYWPIYQMYEQYWILGSKHIISSWSFFFWSKTLPLDSKIKGRACNFYKVFSEKKNPQNSSLLNSLPLSSFRLNACSFKTLMFPNLISWHHVFKQLSTSCQREQTNRYDPCVG
jgi:hypothetical protein